eukprot:CAMPEP_0205907694 /NCGR_PEP_ID=MMETSP1325-20131115/2720_1 /ASSEMBLY_ACC=CAM_ASM_000708 /TAXON_ID=236786 /ORGANISM="Florenciella sp., Strain RCC1007" /LENGTH=40 /DNA_ID= /DNA_START= /DNA_END= /DNA_ORIENTATION=
MTAKSVCMLFALMAALLSATTLFRGVPTLKLLDFCIMWLT